MSPAAQNDVRACASLTSTPTQAPRALVCVRGRHGLERFEEALSLLRKIVPVARRVLGEGHRVTLKTRWSYGLTLYTLAPRSTTSARP